MNGGMGDGKDEMTDEVVEKLSDRIETAERVEMVRGFQDHPDALVLAGVLAVLSGLATRVVRMIRRRRARQTAGTSSRGEGEGQVPT